MHGSRSAKGVAIGPGTNGGGRQSARDYAGTDRAVPLEESRSCPHTVRFLNELEKALCVLDGIDRSLVRDLVAAARDRNYTPLHQM